MRGSSPWLRGPAVIGQPKETGQAGAPSPHPRFGEQEPLRRPAILRVSQSPVDPLPNPSKREGAPPAGAPSPPTQPTLPILYQYEASACSFSEHGGECRPQDPAASGDIESSSLRKWSLTLIIYSHFFAYSAGIWATSVAPAISM